PASCPPAARRISHPPRDQGHRRHLRAAGRQDGRNRRGSAQTDLPEDDCRIQCGGPARHPVQPDSQGRAHPKRSRHRETNWAMPLAKPPYEAYCTTCGVTFTFGGLRIDTDGRVLDTAEKPIPGLYAAGELVGGLFYFNYPGGTGLVSGSVFGKIAGTSAGTASLPR